MNAAIVTVGDELLIGQVRDTNGLWLVEALNTLGVRVRNVSTVGDVDSDIRHVLQEQWPRSDLMIMTGGLGSTPDDLTRAALAGQFRLELLRDRRAEAMLRESFANRGEHVPAACAPLATVPRGFVPLNNPAGIAPGLMFESPGRSLLFALPGVPLEMRGIFQESVAPRIAQRVTRHARAYRTLCTAGIRESLLAEKLADLAGLCELAYLPRPGRVRLRLTVSGPGAKQRLDALESMVRMRIGDAVYGAESDTPESVLGSLLRERGFTIAVAESCTGGQVLDLLTNVPGASEYVMGGVIAYANATKRRMLNVQEATLRSHGAVSRAVALEMAAGVRDRLRADIGLSVTGVAGPGGGSPEKPVGTVWIGYADRQGAEARRFRLGGLRRRNKEWSAILALDMVRRKLSAS